LAVLTAFLSANNRLALKCKKAGAQAPAFSFQVPVKDLPLSSNTNALYPGYGYILRHFADFPLQKDQ
jgi:hypothetical protein